MLLTLFKLQGKRVSHAIFFTNKTIPVELFGSVHVWVNLQLKGVANGEHLVRGHGYQLQIGGQPMDSN